VSSKNSHSCPLTPVPTAAKIHVLSFSYSYLVSSPPD
jgi:hypothetical protein